MISRNMNAEEMYRFFATFNVIEHKFFCIAPESKDENLEYEIFKRYQQKTLRNYWGIRQATDTFLTLDKLYNKNAEESIKFCNLLQKVTDDLLGNYVDIDGIQELFQASYFYFEWMMHLEYKEQEHNYSYYRDHYLHQIRNLYEMFIFLDDLKMWRNCMNIYKNKANSTANWIQESIHSQIASMSAEEKKFLISVGKLQGCVEEPFLEVYCYHYLFEAVAIVSALVHDIGYPIGYMQRTVGKLQHFLPLSYLFIKPENQMPRINSILRGSLLFEVIGEREIEKRLLEHDHGTYSAIVLLFQYYDNGQIFQLPPLKRMVIELSALVIYNHTLKYHFQDAKKAYRYQNVYNENPLSYLFRLCDDLQEWERVYFDISEESNFFVCPICKMPMIRNLQRTEVHRGQVPYQCFCKIHGINTNLFSYRRLVNVAPFDSLSVEIDTVETNSMRIQLHCELRALLQMAKYNPRFAVQRVRGIFEIKEMLRNQADFPSTYLDSFVSCNPLAIKAEVLRRFICYVLGTPYLNYPSLTTIDITERDGNALDSFIENLRNLILDDTHINEIWQTFVIRAQNHAQKSKSNWITGWKSGKNDENEIKRLLLESLRFYYFLITLSDRIRERQTDIIAAEGFTADNLTKSLYDYFNRLADYVGKAWHIYDSSSLALIADYLKQIFCKTDAWNFRNPPYQMLYHHYLDIPVDMVDIVKTYLRNDMYQKICASGRREQENRENLFDYYSDYYFFFVMDELTPRPAS